MRAVVQRVSEASVKVAGREVGRVGRGLLVFLGVGQGDSQQDADALAQKSVQLRCFQDGDSKFNLSLADVGGGLLAVSQFTLYGDCRRGRRPSFSNAAPPDVAVPLYERFVAAVRALGVEAAMGEFGAHMEVALVNDGPVTLLLDSKKAF